MITHPSIFLLEGISSIKYIFIGHYYVRYWRFPGFSHEKRKILTIIIKQLKATSCYEKVYMGPNVEIKKGFLEKILSVEKAPC